MNYSAYSESLFMLDEVGYWDLDVIPEDWHINLKSYFYLHGDLTVTPLGYLFALTRPNQLPAGKLTKILMNRENVGLGSCGYPICS